MSGAVRPSMGQLPYLRAGFSAAQLVRLAPDVPDGHHGAVTIDETIEVGRAALQTGRWEEALAAFEASLAEEETPEALDGMGEALWWLCEARSSVRYRERAYVKFREAGDPESACKVAVNLSISYLVNLGNDAAARGWLARAERVMGDTDPGHMQGWLWLMRGFLSREPDRAREYLAQALEWARDAGDIDLELVALGDLGLALVVAGKPEEGMALLDEAMAGTLAGEYRRLDTVVYTSCNMLAACNHTGDLDRASQWCRVADDFMRDYSCPFLFARCRVHYGSVLLARGQWVQAEEQLQAALQISKDAGPGPQAEALVRLADLRSRQGRLEEADALLSDSNDAVVSLPAAELRLVRGEPAVAVALLVRRIEQLGEGHIEAARTLAMLVDAHVACGDIDAAGEVAGRLDAIAQTRGGHAAALAALASAHLAIAKGQPDAIGQLERALGHLSLLNLPLETARVRLELAAALAKSQPEIAVGEAGTALATFEELGAAADADGAASLLRSLGKPGRTGPKHVGILTKREQEVLHLVGLGLSNPEIAQRLFISRKTVAHHVSNLLAKLGLRNRAEAVAYTARSQYQPAPE
ncbi:MAG TPA: LuxR C-terminal-related transcriptional regulator [Actinomycetota bacterium]|nr:LuxR C-terminal-related transcriptional regulator [Actinomycetota bacterium]